VAWTNQELLRWFVPWITEWMRTRVAGWIWSDATLREGLARSQRVVLQLKRAGVPIVIGSDAPSPWPYAIHTFHGVSTLREIETVVEAGLSPLEAIRAATSTPARMLGLDGEQGTIEPGKRADAVLVAGDPDREIRALRSVRLTIRAGVPHTPAEWMAMAR
jgi:imidazolonepropionase-like amidohydrolase